MSRLDIGDILEGRYRVDQPIARGGMSTVYRCVDLRLGRAVAAKVMHDHFADDPIFVHRFQREALAMAQLTHPNLVGVHDFNADSDPIFLVMELITGGTLRELVAERGPMPPHAATAVMRAVLTGLSVVHAKGLVHRDIKPDNVLINADHRVKLGDFGLVRSSSTATVTSNNIVGTVSYLSPEQVNGSDITTASDVYSAGIVLFELLTGTLPFTGETDLAHALARLNTDVPAPSSRIDGVPPLFDELVATATTRDVSERFSDAGEFLAALDDVAAELALPAFTVPVPKNSAAARTAAKPTDMTGIGATDIFEPTSVIQAARHADAAETDIIDDADNATEDLSFRREPLSFETRVEQPARPEPEDHRQWGDDQQQDVQWDNDQWDNDQWDDANDEWHDDHNDSGWNDRGGYAPPQSGPAPVPMPSPVPAAAPVPAHIPVQPPARYERHDVEPTRNSSPLPNLVTNRSGIKFAAFLVVIAVLATAVAIGGWSYGSGMYGLIPQLLVP